MTLVLVTGVSGFVAGACAKALHEKGYRVRGTVRDLHNSAALCPGIELVAADLLEDAGWDAAVAGCKYVLHVASPFPIEAVQDGDVLVKPAVEGTKRVLAAAVKAGVSRVVQTSSCAAIANGLGGTSTGEHTFTEADWSDPEHKTLAERAAWAFVKDNLALELVVINPCYVQGPLSSSRDCSSAVAVRRLLRGDMAAVPNVGMQICDVRDVAAAHVAAMTVPAAAGQRYIIASGSCWLPDVANLLAKEFGPRGFRVPTRRAPRWLLAVVAIFDGQVRAVLSRVDKQTTYDNTKAPRELGITLHSWEDAVLATAESLVAHGSVTAAAPEAT